MADTVSDTPPEDAVHDAPPEDAVPERGLLIRVLTSLATLIGTSPDLAVPVQVTVSNHGHGWSASVIFRASSREAAQAIARRWAQAVGTRLNDDEGRPITTSKGEPIYSFTANGRLDGLPLHVFAWAPRPIEDARP